MTAPADKHLTTKKAAQYLNKISGENRYSTDIMRQLIHDKDKAFPNAYKDKRTWRIPQSDLDAYWQQVNKQKKGSNAPARWQQFRSRPVVFWPSLVFGFLVTVLGLFFGLISAGADFGAAQERLYEWGLVHRFPPRRDDEILIVIATFDTGAGDPDSDLQDALYNAILEQIKNFDVPNARVEIDTTVIPAHDKEQARQRAEYHDATMIIWGDDTDFQVQTNFLNPTAPYLYLSDTSLDETQRTALAAPAEYVEFVNTELKPQITLLALFAVGHATIQHDNNITIKVLTLILDAYAEKLPTELQANLDDVWFTLGVAYQFENVLSQAIESYGEALTINPEFAGVYNNRGNAYRGQGDLTAAIADYTQALTLDPEFADVYYNRGNAYKDQDDPTAAIADYTQALTLDPKLVVAYINRGVAYSVQGDLTAAIADYTQALTLDSKSAEIYSNRGTAHKGQGDLTAAIADYTQALTLDPELAEAYNNRGNAYRGQGNLTAAIADFTQALTLDPELAAAYYNRGLAYGSQGNLTAAITDFERYLELAPNAPDRDKVEALIQELKASSE